MHETRPRTSSDWQGYLNSQTALHKNQKNKWNKKRRGINKVFSDPDSDNQDPETLQRHLTRIYDCMGALMQPAFATWKSFSGLALSFSVLSKHYNSVTLLSKTVERLKIKSEREHDNNSLSKLQLSVSSVPKCSQSVIEVMQHSSKHVLVPTLKICLRH